MTIPYRIRRLLQRFAVVLLVLVVFSAAVLISWLLYRAFSLGVSFSFVLPWSEILIAVAAVFLVIGLTMLYAGSKIKKENIIDALRQENV